MHDVVLVLALDEVQPGHALIAGEAAHRGTDASLTLASGAVEAIGSPSC